MKTTIINFLNFFIKKITSGIIFFLGIILTGILFVYASSLSNVNNGETLTADTLNGIIDWINNEGASKNEIYTKTEIDSLILNLSNNCPTGFTKIETIATYDNKSRVLGCIQNNVEGTSNWKGAVTNCWTKYGGRLPTYNEVNIIASVSSIYNSHGREWLDGGYSSYSMNVLQSSTTGTNARTSGSDSPGTNNTYRCFIPTGYNL